MYQLPSVKLGEWEPLPEPGWEKQPLTFLSEIDLVAICNNFIHQHVNLYDQPSRIVDSYRSYLIQAFKDLDCLVGRLKDRHLDPSEQINYIIDSSLARAQPWRFTSYLISSVHAQLDIGQISNLRGKQLWNYLKPMVDRSFERGNLYKIEKYTRAAHVLLDISFDIGWDSKFSKSSQLKALEGMGANPQRAATLRELGLYLARNFWKREFYSGAKQILYIGFPDLPEVIHRLSKEQIEKILFEMEPKKAVQLLFVEETAKISKNISCNQIVEGAMRILNGK
ncbi:hypothetical protein [Microbulbifer epialgicus]|uniref:Uncharacterized protein n=1 Tax=Microbulbifer epialgicus TaxID=393907 RepID=A0ABV4NU00_9GAMM